MQKATLFIVAALVFGALGFAFARYCPFASRLSASRTPAPAATSDDTRATINLTTQLQTLRSQLALYRLQHADTNPDFAKYGWKQLTYKTNTKGQISESTKDLSSAVYGPYFMSPPQNPFTKSSEVFTIATIPAGFEAPGAFGFVFEESTNRIFALNAEKKLFPEASASADAR